MNEYVRKKIIATKAVAPIIKENTETKQSGIYLFERTDENGITFFYCGQAKNIFNRIVSHWMGFQHIDVSMRSRGFKSDENPYGWEFTILEYCDESELDEKENAYIMQLMHEGKQTYNVTYGKQGEGKKNIGEGKSPKGYRDGLVQGRKNTQKEIKELFDKYLTYDIKGKPGKIKQRKYDEFTAFLNENNNTEEEDEI
jgi:hypothetical protein